MHAFADIGPAGSKGTVRSMLEEDLGVHVDWVEIPEAYRLIQTDPKARVTVGSGLSKRELVTCVPAQDWDRVVTAMNAEHQGPDEDDEAKRSEPWSLHSWTIKANTKVPAQWKRALRIKSKAGWTDDSPSWRREYLGEWVLGSDGLVYHAYARARNEERKVIWYTEPGRDNPAGLPPDRQEKIGLTLPRYSGSVMWSSSNHPMPISRIPALHLSSSLFPGIRGGCYR